MKTKDNTIDNLPKRYMFTEQKLDRLLVTDSISEANELIGAL